MKTEYPYQLECHNSVIKRYNEGLTKQLIVAFTGGGKTFTLIRLIEKLGFKRVLWLSFQEELVSQSAMAFIKEKFDGTFYNYVKEEGFLEYVSRDDAFFAMKDFKMGCIKAQIFKPDANVVMGSVMTVHKRLHLLDPDYFDCIICDEAHLFMSQSATKVTRHFTPKLLLGCTATPDRLDGVSLGDVFDEIVFEYGLDKGIRDGYAAELDAIRVKTTTDLDAKKLDGTVKVRTTAGDFNNKDLSNEINTIQRNQLIVTKWKQYCEGRQTIAFCVDIEHALHLAEAFRENGISSAAISSDEERTPERSENIKRFKEGKIDVVTNIGVLVAGFDHPDTGAVIMACPTKSLTKYLQSAGRCARLKSAEYVAKFGQNAIILDIVDSTTRHNLVNAWELDKEKPLEDRTFTTQEKKDKILAERLKRKAVIEHERKEDERVSLLKIPKYIVNKSIKMQEEATEAQLKWLKDLGHDTDNQHFTKFHANEIINQLPANKTEIAKMKKLGYDVDSRTVVTKQDYNAVKREIFNKLNKKSQPYQKR